MDSVFDFHAKPSCLAQSGLWTVALLRLLLQVADQSFERFLIGVVV